MRLQTGYNESAIFERNSMRKIFQVMWTEKKIISLRQKSKQFVSDQNTKISIRLMESHRFKNTVHVLYLCCWSHVVTILPPILLYMGQS